MKPRSYGGTYTFFSSFTSFTCAEQRIFLQNQNPGIAKNLPNFFGVLWISFYLRWFSWLKIAQDCLKQGSPRLLRSRYPLMTILCQWFRHCWLYVLVFTFSEYCLPHFSLPKTFLLIAPFQIRRGSIWLNLPLKRGCLFLYGPLHKLTLTWQGALV